ncbi:MAG: hypothetical protein JW923_02180 [Spirochaetales bacterium]|nr:hypothetical protein [Spirochaetales bacterium]
MNSYTDYSEQYVARSLERLDHPSEYPNSHMGRSISVHQNRALVGCPTIGADVGAFVYELDASGIWKHVATLKPSDLDPRDEAGTTGAIHGDLALVGAPRRSSLRGAVFVFARGADGSWTQEAELAAPSPLAGDYFGASLALYGDRAVIGAPDKKAGAIESAGIVYVFKRSGTAWSLEATLDDNSWTDYRLGTSLAMGDGIILAGATGAEYAFDPEAVDNVACGLVYVYEYDGTSWSHTRELVPNEGIAGLGFGSSLAFDGDRAVVAALGNPSSGIDAPVCIFKRDSGTGSWAREAQFVPPSTGSNTHQYRHVSIAAGRMAVSDPYDNRFASNAGIAWVYRLCPDGLWRMVSVLSSPNPDESNWFGSAVAVHPTGILVGEERSATLAETAGAVFDFRK